MISAARFLLSFSPSGTDGEKLRRHLAAVSDVRCYVRNAVETKNPLYLGVNNSALQMALDRAYGELAAARPFAVCPFCQGLAADSCRACKGVGFLGKDAYYRIVPKELQFGEH